MEQVTVSSKGQIAIPKKVRDLLNLSEGTKLSLSVRGHEIVLSKEPAWKSLQGAGAGAAFDLTAALEEERRRDRELEDRP